MKFHNIVVWGIIFALHSAFADTQKIAAISPPSFAGGLLRNFSIPFDDVCGGEEDLHHQVVRPYVEGIGFKSYSGRVGTLTSKCSGVVGALQHVPSAAMVTQAPESFEVSCPAGSAAVGIKTYTSEGPHAYFSYLDLGCRKFEDFAESLPDVQYRSGTPRQWPGTPHSMTPQPSTEDPSITGREDGFSRINGSFFREISCPDGMVIVGLHGSQGWRMDSIGITCSDEPVSTYLEYMGRPALTRLATGSSPSQEVENSFENSSSDGAFPSRSPSAQGPMIGSKEMSAADLVANYRGNSFYEGNHGALERDGRLLSGSSVKNAVERGRKVLHRIVSENFSGATLTETEKAQRIENARAIVFALWQSAYAHGQDMREGTFVLRDGGKVFDYLEGASRPRISSHLKSRETSLHYGITLESLPKGMGALLLIKFRSYSPAGKPGEWLTFIKPEPNGTEGLVETAMHLVDYAKRAPARLFGVTDSEHGERKERIPDTALREFESSFSLFLDSGKTEEVLMKARLFGYAFMVETLTQIQNGTHPHLADPTSDPYVLLEGDRDEESSTQEIHLEPTKPGPHLVSQFIFGTLGRADIGDENIEVRTGHEVIVDFRDPPRDFDDPFWFNGTWLSTRFR